MRKLSGCNECMKVLLILLRIKIVSKRQIADYCHLLHTIDRSNLRNKRVLTATICGMNGSQSEQLNE